MRRNNIDLAAAAVIVAVNIIWSLLPNPSTIVGIVLSLPLIFILPGYMLTEAMFHERSLEISHRLTLSLSLSLTVVIIGGFLLNLLPSGLRAIPWAIFLGLLIMEFAVWITFLRRKVGTTKVQTRRLHFVFGLGKKEYIYLCLAAVIGVFAIRYSVAGVVNQPTPGFTQLWILPSKRENTSTTIRFGVRSFEHSSLRYQATLIINGALVKTWSSIALSPQEEWDQAIMLTPKTSSGSQITIQLYRLDNSKVVYREVHLTLPFLQKNKGSGIVH